MAAEPCDPLKLHDQDVVNFQKDDTAADSDDRLISGKWKQKF
jgi:hypothetical protein